MDFLQSTHKNVYARMYRNDMHDLWMLIENVNGGLIVVCKCNVCLPL